MNNEKYMLSLGGIKGETQKVQLETVKRVEDAMKLMHKAVGKATSGLSKFETMYGQYEKMRDSNIKMKIELESLKKDYEASSGKEDDFFENKVQDLGIQVYQDGDEAYSAGDTVISHALKLRAGAKKLGIQEPPIIKHAIEAGEAAKKLGERVETTLDEAR